MKKFLFPLLCFLLFTALAQAQTTPAVTLTYLESTEVLDSCSGCTNPYQSYLFTGVKVTAGTRVTYIAAPYSIRRYSTGRLRFELKSGLTSASVRFAYGQVNSTTYPSATRLYDDLRVHAQLSPGLYTIVTDTTTTTLTNAHAETVINFAATQATHTLNLPATPVNGQIAMVTFNSIVTALTVAGNGTTLRGTAATTGVVGTVLVYRYYGTLATPAWIRQLI